MDVYHTFILEFSFWFRAAGSIVCNYTMFYKKEPLIFDYNSRIFMETGMNTLQSHVIYLRNCLMT